MQLNHLLGNELIGTLVSRFIHVGDSKTRREAVFATLVITAEKTV